MSDDLHPCNEPLRGPLKRRTYVTTDTMPDDSDDQIGEITELPHQIDAEKLIRKLEDEREKATDSERDDSWLQEEVEDRIAKRVRLEGLLGEEGEERLIEIVCDAFPDLVLDMIKARI